MADVEIGVACGVDDVRACKDHPIGRVIEPAVEAHVDHCVAKRLSVFCRMFSATLHRPLQRRYHKHIRTRLLAAERTHLRGLRDVERLARDLCAVTVVVDGFVAFLREEQRSPRGAPTKVRV